MERRQKQPFAVIRFDDENITVELIRTEWATFHENDVIVSTLFPPLTSEKEFYHILEKNPPPGESWTDCGYQ